MASAAVAAIQAFLLSRAAISSRIWYNPAWKIETNVTSVRADICYAAAQDALKRALFSLEEALIFRETPVAYCT
jgi:hypothetical protein